MILIITRDIASNYLNHITLFSNKHTKVEKQRVRMKTGWVVGLMRRSLIIKNKLGSSFFFFYFFFISLFFCFFFLKLKFENI